MTWYVLRRVIVVVVLAIAVTAAVITVPHVHHEPAHPIQIDN